MRWLNLHRFVKIHLFSNSSAQFTSNSKDSDSDLYASRSFLTSGNSIIISK